jgi:CRP-like cAMP-binding protein
MAEPPRLSPAELKTLFLFEALEEDQLDWLSERGRVEVRSGGTSVYEEGEDATCFFVLLSGTLSMLRRVEDTEVETVRRQLETLGHKVLVADTAAAALAARDCRKLI